MKNLMSKIADGIEEIMNGAKYLVSAGLIASSVNNLAERKYGMAAFGGGLGVYILVQELVDEYFQKERTGLISDIEETCSKIEEVCDKW